MAMHMELRSYLFTLAAPHLIPGTKAAAEARKRFRSRDALLVACRYYERS